MGFKMGGVAGADGASAIVRAMWRHTRSVRWILAVNSGTILVTSILKVVLPALIGLLINVIQVRGLAGLRDSVWLGSAVVAVLAFNWIVRVPVKLAQIRVAKVAQCEFTACLQADLFRAPLAWHDQRHSGDTASRLSQGGGALFGFTLDQHAYLEAALMLSGPLIALWLLSPPACIITSVAYAGIVVLCLAFDAFQRKYWVREADVRREYGTGLIDAFRNVLTVYAMRRETAIASRLDAAIHQVLRTTEVNGKLTEIKWSIVEILSTMLTFGMILFYIISSSIEQGSGAGSVALGNVYMVMSYLQSGTAALLAALAHIASYSRYRTEFAMTRPLRSLATVPDPKLAIEKGWQRIELTEVDVFHPGADQPAQALCGISVSLLRGRSYALLGSNGSGKSTLLKVLSGLQSVAGGQVAIDGKPTASGELRTIATLVPQQPELFAGTILSNIAFLDNSISSEMVDCDDLVSMMLAGLGDSLDAEVTESGSNWSGGQRQRIALARGVLAASTSSIVLVDEPTSSIDTESERKIIDKLKIRYAEDCLVIAIHNLDLAQHFDEVIQLEQGRLANTGYSATIGVAAA